MAHLVRSPRNGFTLVELMVALALGLLLVLGVSSVYVAQRQTYRLTENLARMQDSVRIAFELMARDIREAGGMPCGRSGYFTNQIVTGNPQSVWMRWPGEHGITEGGLVGYRLGDPDYPLPAGVAAAQQVNGSDALMLRTASLHETLGYASQDVAGRIFDLGAAHGFAVGDVLMACDHKRSMLFEVANVNGNQMGYANGVDLSSVFDGAFSDGLDDDGLIGKLSTSVWLVRDNGRGGRSLYRIISTNDATAGTTVQGGMQEIAEGVVNMQITYLTRSGNVAAETYRDIAQLHATANGTEVWANGPEGRLVTAVRVDLTLESLDAVGADGNNLQRTLTQVVSLRHREWVND
ncbi:prepilin-type N-terminal cleavage/methylation domain-containing protein [Pseudothauera nasutitermitis]|uniref:Prepilin-type N-terminal cleavage/methylation domain-containing protein n=1 Tax=Pseudothauera nasutitermitis TaxID=2565930 RepID=A0A4S4B093_9RHOO|nr:PilW family protein [Pseudothauera nasutitermitis]THF65893.1 prepilin-type N-terminal cleavage/methylation domain-containing protein [Pseudothauera nasutitermitis]